MFNVRLVVLLFFESILSFDMNGNSVIDTSTQRGFIILSIIMMIILLIIIFIVNAKYNCNFFIFSGLTYKFIESFYLFIYVFTVIDEYGLKFMKFEETSA